MVSPPAGPASEPLVARGRELALLDDVVASVHLGDRFVVLRGPTGIGKTTLWRAALRRHAAAGHRVLATRPAPDELALPAVGLRDLFGDTDPDPAVLRPDADRFERAHALRATLGRLADEGPVVVAVDDVQWLDPVSGTALRHAFRRLRGEPVAVVVTEGSEARTPSGEPLIPTGRREEIDLEPLDLAGVRAVVATAGPPLPRPVLDRIHELSGGNPMFAVELARVAAGPTDLLALSAPPTLREVLSGRLGTISDEGRDLLRLLAAAGPSPVATLADVGGVADPRPLVDAAVASGIVSIDSRGIARFTHPILGSALLAELDPLTRQTLHRRLAAASPDPDARARHLALSTAEPDADVAGELQDAARRAAHRGASALAAELADRSLRLTPEDELVPRVRRTFLAAVHRAAAGDRAGALARTEELLAFLPSGPVRAEALTLRVGLDFADGDRFLDRALAEAGDDELRRARILELQGWMAALYRGEPRRALALGEPALAAARRHGDAVLEMLAASSVATASVMVGAPRPDLMARAMELAEAAQGPLLGRWPQALHGRVALWCGDLVEARATFEKLHATFLHAGVEFQRPFRLFDLAELELAAGNLALAAELAADGIESARDADNEQATAWLSYPAGLAMAHRGEPDRARAAADVLDAVDGAAQGQARQAMAHAVRGLAALTEGRPAAAVSALAPGLAIARAAGLRLPSVVPVLPDAIEASALVGDAAAATALADELGRDAAAVGQPWVDAAALRGRGLAALATGDARAAPLLQRAADRFDDLGYLLDGARARLLVGQAHRRAGQRRASAEALGDARARFAGMGAAPWAALADAELARVSATRGRAALTPTEARIAELVCEGRRNREIAGELFISVSTVEAHLTRMYRKLQVRSRSELARRLG